MDMTTQSAYTLIKPQSKELAFQVFDFEDDHYFRERKQHNYYSIILVTKGAGRLRADFSEYIFKENTLMCFAVYQPFLIEADDEFAGVLIHFHPDFFCIHKHQEEVACNGVLFNNIYEPPLFRLPVEEMDILLKIVGQLKVDMQKPGLAQYELLVSYLKIFLINASRMKVGTNPEYQPKDEHEPFILKNLKDAIEEYYRIKHAPAEYAELLNISPKALNKLTRTHFNQTLSKLITERIIIEAKRELYLTSKAIKTIAYDLGFHDEFYFSRFFKNNTEVSPQVYRSTVGFAKGDAL